MRPLREYYVANFLYAWRIYFYQDDNTGRLLWLEQKVLRV